MWYIHVHIHSYIAYTCLAYCTSSALEICHVYIQCHVYTCTCTPTPTVCTLATVSSICSCPTPASRVRENILYSCYKVHELTLTENACMSLMNWESEANLSHLEPELRQYVREPSKHHERHAGCQRQREGHYHQHRPWVHTTYQEREKELLL